MCSVSVVSDYYRDRSRDWQTIPMPGPMYPYNPAGPLPPVSQWDRESKQLLREVIERLDKLDHRLRDIECHDKSKAELRRQLGLA
jgi:hypothetical protein